MHAHFGEQTLDIGNKSDPPALHCFCSRRYRLQPTLPPPFSGAKLSEQMAHLDNHMHPDVRRHPGQR